MTNKLYDKIKTFIKENFKILIIFILGIFLLTFKLPYYISAPGGLINTSSRVDMISDFKMKGSLNMAYVTEYEGTIPMLLIGLLNKNWDIESEDDVTVGSESIKDVNFRNKLLLEEANSTALLVAYNYSNIKYKKENNKSYVTYIDDLAQTDLKVGDEIKEIDGVKINSKSQIFDVLKEKSPNTKINIKVVNNKKKYKRYANLLDVQGSAKIGVLITETYKLKSDYNVDLKFKSTESGSSGGLMLSLTLYSYLNKVDLTGGRKIVGTGTIDNDGNVGEISGVKYKLLGACKKKANVFLVPYGNYNEAKRVKKEHNLKIKLVPVKTFDDALNYLKKDL